MPDNQKYWDSGNNPCKYFDSAHNYCNWVIRSNGLPEGVFFPRETAMICTCYCQQPSDCSQYKDYIRIENIDRQYRQESKSNSGGCYIATVCYGSYDCIQVLTFRNFRDTYLAQTTIGKIFIKIYYTLSPSIAEFLKNKYRINTFIRVNILDRIYALLMSR